MTRTAVTALGVALSAIFLVPLTQGAAITGTVTAGPGTTLSASSNLTFYVDVAGPVTFAPGVSGTSPGCSPIGSPTTWGCSFDINDRIQITGIDSAVISGTSTLGIPGNGGGTIVTSTICGGGPAQAGLLNCTNSFAPGIYSVSLNLSENIDTQKLLNSTAVAGTRSLSVTISGPGVLATPEPGTLGGVALALGTLYGFVRRVRRVSVNSLY